MLHAVAQTVFERMEFASTVQDILRSAWNVVRTISADYHLTLFQQDIAGFYNAVPHDQICVCIRILVDRFVREQSTTFEQVLSVSKCSDTTGSGLSRSMEETSTPGRVYTSYGHLAVGKILSAKFLLDCWQHSTTTDQECQHGITVCSYLLRLCGCCSRITFSRMFSHFSGELTVLFASGQVCGQSSVDVC